MADSVHQLVHGYEHGHRLLAGSISLGREEQDLVTRLSDLSGGMARGEELVPYVSTYPLPSRAYYALAKTWPDPSAPRAGCVLTHTLLVPMQAWKSAADIAVFDMMLRNPHREVTRVGSLQPLEVPDVSSPTAGALPVHEPGFRNFVVKFFAEGIRPLVWFDAQQPEATMWRLLAATWPALRAELACCTLALQPRALDERPFDVMFAPGSSRARFAEYLGAHEVVAANAETVEPWVSEWIARVLGGVPNPDTAVDDLRAGLDENPSSIRKVYLFRDLRERARSTPLAAIGAMDVLESLGALRSEVRWRTSDLVKRAIEATAGAPPTWALEVLCLVGLRLDRSDGGLIEPETEQLLAEHVQDCVARVPVDAIQLAERILARDAGKLPCSFVRGLSTALASSKDEQMFETLATAATVGPGVVDVSPEAAVTFLEVGRRLGRPWAEVVASWYGATRSPATREALRLLLVPEISTAAEAPLLLDLLRDLAAEELSGLFASVWCRAVALEIGRLYVELVGERFPLDASEYGAARGVAPHTAGSYIAAGAVPLSVEGVAGLAAARGREFVVGVVIDRALRRASPCLRGVAMDGTVWRSLLSEGDDEVVAGVLVRLVANLERSAICRVPGGEGMVGDAPRPVHSHGVRQILLDHVSGLASSAELRRWLTMPWASSVLRRDASMLRTLLTDEASLRDRTGEGWLAAWSTLEVVSALPVDMEAPIREILAVLLRRRPIAWPDEVTAIWVRLLQGLLHDPPGHEEACAQALRFCFENPRLPLGPVVAHVFAHVHAAALRDQERRSWDFFGLTGWDKGSELRRRLVDSFLAGTWEPHWFVFAADEPWLLRKLCKRMLRQWRGQRFLERAFDALQTLPPTPLAQELSEILRDPDYFVDWD